MQEAKSYSLVEKDFSYSPAMIDDEPGRRAAIALIQAKAVEKKENLASLSRKIPRNHAYLQQFVHRNVPRELPEPVRERLASLLDVAPDQLRNSPKSDSTRRFPPSLALQNGPPPTKPVETKRTFPPSLAALNSPPDLINSVFPRALADLPIPPEMAGHTVPLLGQGAAGPNGAFPFNGERVADIPAPPSLQGVHNAYAIYVFGDSMEPRYEQGEIVFVDPTRPARSGDYVVVQIADEEKGTPHEGYIKQYVRQNQKQLTLFQFKPKKTLTFPMSKVKSIEVIVFSGRG